MPNREIKVKEKHTYVMFIVKLNNAPSEGCDTSQADNWKKLYMMEKEEINSH